MISDVYLNLRLGMTCWIHWIGVNEICSIDQHTVREIKMEKLNKNKTNEIINALHLIQCHLSLWLCLCVRVCVGKRAWKQSLNSSKADIYLSLSLTKTLLTFSTQMFRHNLNRTHIEFLVIIFIMLNLFHVHFSWKICAFKFMKTNEFNGRFMFIGIVAWVQGAHRLSLHP